MPVSPSRSDKLLAAAPCSKANGCSVGVGSVVVYQVQKCDSRAFF